ncbi:hypothetical protein Gohar_026856 [Gossypium harknessii]|uniref:Uncharacterized protein n=1 Tax=Gossypium harknessii TaxID=34285 RepID=A0A7J9HSU1_9ROSI|nr:hypothetical protein [Gossypium harknessii]
MKSHFRCLYKHFHQVFVPSTRRIEEFLESSMDDSEHSTHQVPWSFVGFFNWHMGSHQLFLVDGFEPIRIEELKKESTPFVTRNEATMKLLEVAQTRYQKFIKLMRRKKKNGE